MNPTADLDAVAKDKNCPCKESNSGRPSLILVNVHVACVVISELRTEVQVENLTKHSTCQTWAEGISILTL